MLFSKVVDFGIWEDFTESSDAIQPRSEAFQLDQSINNGKSLYVIGSTNA
jgi:hypothetical protein